jgi:glutathione S-transferase
MRLYHIRGTRSGRVLWLLEEIGEPYDITLMQRGEQRSDEHRTRHPLGRVPVAEDDEGFLWESAALCLHIADLHPEAGLIPPVGTHDRGLVYQWVLYAMAELESAVVDAFSDEDAIQQRGRERFAANVVAVERELDGKEFLVGGRFTVADLVVGGVLGFAARGGLLEQFPRSSAYADKLRERDAWKRAGEIGKPAE